MRNFLLCIFCLILVSACTNEVKTVETIYPLQIKDLIRQEKDRIRADQQFEKILWSKGKHEKVTISKEQYAIFVESLSTYDINKAAYKNAFLVSNQIGRDAYFLLEDKLPIKKIYFDRTPKESLFIYYDNTNKLFSSRHIIKWKQNVAISIFRITKIWGLDADTTLIQIRRK